MSEQLRRHGPPAASAAVIAAIVGALFQFGLIGPAREEERIAVEKRLATLEARESAMQADVTQRLNSLERLIEARLAGIERSVSAIERSIENRRISSNDSTR